AMPLLFVVECSLQLKQWLLAPPFSLRDKVVVITGASSGIGAALGEQCAAQGARVVLVARRKEQLVGVAERCRENGAREVRIETCDVAVEEQVRRVMDDTGAAFGHIDLIVLNAGISMGEYAKNCEDISPFTQIMATNYNGFVAGALYALPYLKKAQRGKIVAVSSVLGLVSGPTRTGYCASKFAMKGFLDSLRLEEPSIDMTMVYPGVVKTDINRTRLGTQADIITDAKGVMTAEQAAALVLDAVQRGARDSAFSFQYNVLYFIKDVFPRVRDVLMDRAFRKLIQKKKE
ncbi:hypothetical protein HDU98_012080, partial [Podochytrium sp. JEL0797]